MIWLPRGVRKGEVADPVHLSAEYQRAKRIINQTTHYQWGQIVPDSYTTTFAVDSSTQHVPLGGSGESGEQGDQGDPLQIVNVGD